jgi:hypothetical protein
MAMLSPGGEVEGYPGAVKVYSRLSGSLFFDRQGIEALFRTQLPDLVLIDGDAEPEERMAGGQRRGDGRDSQDVDASEDDDNVAGARPLLGEARQSGLSRRQGQRHGGAAGTAPKPSAKRWACFRLRTSCSAPERRFERRPADGSRRGSRRRARHRTKS